MCSVRLCVLNWSVLNALHYHHFKIPCASNFTCTWGLLRTTSASLVRFAMSDRNHNSFRSNPCFFVLNEAPQTSLRFQLTNIKQYKNIESRVQVWVWWLFSGWKALSIDPSSGPATAYLGGRANAWSFFKSVYFPKWDCILIKERWHFST